MVVVIAVRIAAVAGLGDGVATARFAPHAILTRESAITLTTVLVKYNVDST